jgi:diguanylate cyclase (GGDEF)-like protein
MGAQANALVIVGSSLAAGILLLGSAVVSGILSNQVAFAVAGVVAGAVIGLGAGLTLRERKPAPPDASPNVPNSVVAPSSPKPDPRLDETPDDGGEDEAVVLFTHQLVAATTTDQVRLTISRHLPALLGTRRLWIASHLKGRRQVIVPEPLEEIRREALLDADSQEWTTFTLRIDDEVVGMLGVEGRVLSPRVRRRIQLVTPVIAQVLSTAHAIDTLRETSLVDLLTGAATRREGTSRLRSEIKRAQRSGSPMSVLMLDLDQFKLLNDRHGHPVGDAMLTAVGRTMLRTLRASDVRCRWGGEEFLVVLPDTDLPRAQIVANGLLRNIAAISVPTPSGPVGTTVSVGITVALPDEIDTEAIVQRADTALYRAKSAGRACIRVVLGGSDGGAVTEPTESAPKPAPNNTLSFLDRRNPQTNDRRSVPSPGRRSTDPRPDGVNEVQEVAVTADARLVRTSLR